MWELTDEQKKRIERLQNVLPSIRDFQEVIQRAYIEGFSDGRTHVYREAREAVRIQDELASKTSEGKV